MIFNSPVYPIPPSFINDELELNSTHKYLDYLSEKGAKTIMSTEGTSQFNLLTSTEVDLFNNALLNFKGKKILIGRARMFEDKTKDLDDPGMLAFNKLSEAF